MTAKPLLIALSKGRILDETLPLLAQAGIVPTEDPAQSRKLILDTNHDRIKLVVIRAADVPTYVEYGAADIGVAGKDVLMEHQSDNLYEMLDLQISRCRLMVAGFPDAPPIRSGMKIRVATKFVNVARQYFASQGVQVEAVKLYGSMELAPIVGLADRIVDIVDTGKTLKANGLVPMETIADISSLLVVNKASLKTQHSLIHRLIQDLQQAVAAQLTENPA